jgi:PIN domain nuclease of toxin-antitoxin system
VRILLDTHIVLWWLEDNHKLSKRSRARIKAASAVYVSSVTIWETAMKVRRGTLKVDLDALALQIGLDGFLELGISHRHVAMVASLPYIHRDPFDRMLVAQAMKVVILGQDPYHTPGAAMGFCFSVPDGNRPQPSLQNIFQELHNDLGIDRRQTDLTDWAQQGVFLLNSVLTVRAREAGSHANKGFFGSKPFLRANDYLLVNGQPPIHWA